MTKIQNSLPVITGPDGLPVDRNKGRYAILRDEFLAASDLKGGSLKTYRNAVNVYFAWILDTGRDISALSQADIRLFKKNLLEAGRSPLTVNSYLLVVRKFYEWAEATLSYPNIAKGVKSVAPESGFVKMHLTPAQATLLLDHFAGDGSPRNLAMVNLMVRGGLRTVEVSRSRVGHLRYVMSDKGPRLVLYVFGKKHEDTDSLSSRNFIVLSAKAAEPLVNYLVTRGFPNPSTPAFAEAVRTRGDEPMFPTEGKGHRGKAMSTRNIQKIVKDGLLSIGLAGHQYSAHSLRHTTAVAILKYGNGTFNDVQRVLRHKSINTSQIYTESIERDLHIENPSEFLVDKSF